MSDPRPIPNALLELPAREGPRPQTGPAMPHVQLSDRGDLAEAQRIVEAIGALPGVRLGRSKVSDPRSIAFHLDDDLVRASEEEAPLGGEFAHVHPFDGGSQHLVLPSDWGDHLIEKGWAEPHPIAERLPRPVLFMVYGPRVPAETEHVIEITKASYAHLRGVDPDGVS
jgi:Family of unknown function (DUF5519)